jgi:steroid delta-isomerase-like uncharacterized protein
MDDTKAIARRYIEEVWNQGKSSAVGKIVAANVVGHVGGTDIRGAETIRKRLNALRTAFSDVQFTVEDSIADGDKVFVRWTFRGRNTGAYMGAKATGKSVTVTGMNLFRIEGGKIQELWVQADDLGELRQLGLVKEPK